MLENVVKFSILRCLMLKIANQLKINRLAIVLDFGCNFAPLRREMGGAERPKRSVSWWRLGEERKSVDSVKREKEIM